MRTITLTLNEDDLRALRRLVLKERLKGFVEERDEWTHIDIVLSSAIDQLRKEA